MGEPEAWKGMLLPCHTARTSKAHGCVAARGELRHAQLFWQALEERPQRRLVSFGEGSRTSQDEQGKGKSWQELAGKLERSC